ncbi:tigger transposable element-derived protein 6-like [Parasteatoda tepidariorum]|uniref:tigger transposable element-derived protein 6-like n=1 Tax=Parasteatoda tepidariorum TaxID=114398 RepID=UPI0039BCB6FA
MPLLGEIRAVEMGEEVLLERESFVRNADETGLFYQLMPDKTMAFKGENCKGGKKSKQRLTVLLCANSTGTDKLKPFVIGKYAKPRCFKNVTSLPVDYKANKRAWMTEEIFNNWLLDVDKEMKRKKKKIALLVDNCTPHNNPPNIKLFYFPPNCTSILQPLDLGIIKCFKGYYRKRLVQNVVYNLDNKLPNPYAVDVKNACDWISGGWNSLTQSTIQNCWKKASFFEDKSNGDAETELTEITDEEEKCVAGLNSIVSDFQRSSNASFLFNADEFLNLDNDVLVFSGASDEEIVAEVIPGDQSDEEEAADCSQNRTQISPENAILLINTLQDFVATLPNVIDVHLNSLDGLKSRCMEMAIASKNKQTKLTNNFSK